MLLKKKNKAPLTSSVSQIALFISSTIVSIPLFSSDSPGGFTFTEKRNLEQISEIHWHNYNKG